MPEPRKPRECSEQCVCRHERREHLAIEDQNSITYYTMCWIADCDCIEYNPTSAADAAGDRADFIYDRENSK